MFHVTLYTYAGTEAAPAARERIGYADSCTWTQATGPHATDTPDGTVCVSSFDVRSRRAVRGGRCDASTVTFSGASYGSWLVAETHTRVLDGPKRAAAAASVPASGQGRCGAGGHSTADATRLHRSAATQAHVDGVTRPSTPSLRGGRADRAEAGHACDVMH